MTDDAVELDRLKVIGNFLRDGDYQSAEAFALSVDGEWQRAESLTQVARAVASTGRLEEARRIWSVAITVAQEGEHSPRSQDSYDSSSVLCEIAEDLALAGDVETAQTIAANVKNEHKKKRAQENLADIANGDKGSFYKLRDGSPY